MGLANPSIAVSSPKEAPAPNTGHGTLLTLLVCAPAVAQGAATSPVADVLAARGLGADPMSLGVSAGPDGTTQLTSGATPCGVVEIVRTP